MSGPSILKRGFERAVREIDHRIGWDRLPVPLGLLALVGIRDTMRDANLFDNHDVTPSAPPPADDSRHLVARTIDGSYNDLTVPSMGMAGRGSAATSPGRRRARGAAAALRPEPAHGEQRTALRSVFQPATTLNVLAAAWLQFETRDWFSHGTDPANPILVPRPLRRRLARRPDALARPPLLTRPPRPGQGGEPRSTPRPTGGTRRRSTAAPRSSRRAIRAEDGSVRVDSRGLIDVDPALIGSSGGADGWWLGMELMHTIFMREHNAIVDKLRSAYPSWSGDELFDKARLINAALIAKIHTVEWTTAILGHPTLQIGMRANWWGLAQKRVYDRFGRISKLDLVSGIPGSATAHHSAPYAMTEDFVSVYRMHPLVPDDYVMRNVDSGATTNLEFMDLHLLKARSVIERFGATNALFSLGVAHPGALNLHNSPRFMHRLERTDGVFIDLLALDILRSRERGVPRYNEFRRQLHMRPVQQLRRARGGRRDPRTAPRDLRGRPREGRSHGRHVRRTRPARLRVQRHSVPDLRSHGESTSQE